MGWRSAVHYSRFATSSQAEKGRRIEKILDHSCEDISLAFAKEALHQVKQTVNSIHYINYRLGFGCAKTQTSEPEQRELRRWASGKRRLAEIGVFHGVNTRALRQAMAPDGILLAIDPFPRRWFGIRGYGWARRIAHREVSQVSNGKVVWIEDLGHNVPLRQDLAIYFPVDFVFIDGDHTWEGIKADWESWASCVAPNGIIALHDSANRNNAGSERFTNEVVLLDTRFEKVAVVDSLTVVKRL